MGKYEPICTPHLPQSNVSAVVVSEEYPQVICALQSREITVLKTVRCDRLDFPVASHTDMQLLPLGDGVCLISLHQSKLKRQLEAFHCKCLVGETLSAKYPLDVPYNAVRIADSYICNCKTISKTAKELWNTQNLCGIFVRQGYTKCSICIVDEHSLITADVGIAKAVQAAGFSVLQIQPGFIQIPQYDTGFIGGCCGKLSQHLMAFTGKLDSHPDGQRIREFLQQRQIDVVELTQENLFDIGGIIPVTENI